MSSWTRARFEDTALSFLWDQWTQLGLSGQRGKGDRRVIDPEALLLLGLRVGPRDARLFGEMLDWVRVNGRLISVKRLRNLSGDERTRRLADAALAWAGTHEPALQLWAKSMPRPKPKGELESLGNRLVQRTDPVFAAFGFSWPDTPPSGKSMGADLAAPAALALRLRALFGVGARAEVIRYLYTTDRPESSVADVARVAGFGKRNIHDALAELASAGAIRQITRGNGFRCSLDTAAWDRLLGVSDAAARPVFEDWVELLPAVARVIEWFDAEVTSDWSPYIRASDARQLVGEIGPALRGVGIGVPDGRDALAEAYWEVFEEVLDGVAAALGPSETDEISSDPELMGSLRRSRKQDAQGRRLRLKDPK